MHVYILIFLLQVEKDIDVMFFSSMITKTDNGATVWENALFDEERVKNFVHTVSVGV